MKIRRNGNSGLGLVAGLCLVALMGLLVYGEGPMKVLAEVQREDPGYRCIGVQYMTSSTSTAGVIGTANDWEVVANGSQYTDKFKLSTAQRKLLGVNVSTTEVNAVTHVLYLQASNDKTSWANLEDATAASEAGNQYDESVVQSMLAKVSITAIGDKAVRFTNIPPFLWYRFHLDSGAAIYKADHLSISDY